MEGTSTVRLSGNLTNARVRNACETHATRVYTRLYRRRPLINRPRTERIWRGPVQTTAFIHLAMITDQITSVCGPW